MRIDCVAMSAQATKNAITLKGSTAIVTEFFNFAINRCVPLEHAVLFPVYIPIVVFP